MRRGFRIMSIFLGLLAFADGRHEAPKTPENQADVCEMLRDSHIDMQLHYPNEYYDCAAHSHYIKEAATRPSKVAGSAT